MSTRFDTFSPPPPEPDPWATATPTATADDDALLDPCDAAALLEQTARQAERELGDRPAWLFLVAAVVVLVAYGVVWLSVRDQHPYVGPAGWALAVLYGTLATWVALISVVLGRRLSGRSSRQRRLQGLVFAPIWICVYVFEGALYHVDPNHAIAFGVWVASAPLIVVGAAAAGYHAARGHSGQAGFAVAAVLLGTFAAFAGPNAVWGVVGVGLCALLLVGWAAQLWERRARA